MKISALIAELKETMKREGDIEVTCTGSNIEECAGKPFPDVFETTVEHLIVRHGGGLGTRVRLYL